MSRDVELAPYPESIEPDGPRYSALLSHRAVMALRRLGLLQDEAPEPSAFEEKLTVETTRLQVERFQAMLRKDRDQRHFTKPGSYQTAERDRVHTLEAFLTRLPEQRSVSAEWPKTWWDHLKKDLGARVKILAMNQRIPARLAQWLFSVGHRLLGTVRWERRAWTASKLFLDPLPPPLRESDSFCIFTTGGPR